MRNFSTRTSCTLSFPFSGLSHAGRLESTRDNAWKLINSAMDNPDGRKISELTPSEGEVRVRFLLWTASVWKCASWREAECCGSFVFVNLNTGNTVVLIPEIDDYGTLPTGVRRVTYPRQSHD